ncbi:Uncharacterised protein [Acinetobacter baumannii]|nr:Uncharacterised protein [Acinetobacter baumannii]
MRFPLPPAAGAFARVGKIRRANRAVLSDMRHQLGNTPGMLLHPRAMVFPAHIVGIQHAMAHQGEIAARQKAGFMRPVFH